MQIIHVDADSFYASCEELFRPALKGKPVVDFTTNDFVIISFNVYAHKIGLKRGDIIYEISAVFKHSNVV